MAPKRVLCVAEKPSVARELANMLSKGSAQQRNTNARYISVFEFPYMFEGRPCNFVVTSVIGHLQDMDFTERHRKWFSCCPLDLLKLDTPVVKSISEDKKQLERLLQDEGRRAQQLILFLDGDREGENISFQVVDVCRAANPRIEIKRAHFSALIRQQIERAMANLVSPDKNLSDAVDARREIDLRLGAAFTRFQTLHLSKGFEDLKDKILSWGPCQFATLGFIVDRAWKIERFVAEDFWSISMTVDRGLDGRAVFDWNRGRLFDCDSCLSLYEEMLESAEAVVTSVRENIKRKWKPPPLSTTELQVLASRKLRLPSDQTMKIAEELYTSGLISYPRTETEIFKEGTDLRGLISQQLPSQQWGAFANMLLNHAGFEWPRPGKNDDMAHPPIHPTAFAPNLDGDKKRLYELIVRRFLACCSKDAVGAETAIDVDIAEETFTCKGLMIKERNYLEVYTYDKWSDKNIPVFVMGEGFTPTELTMSSGRTQAPSLLTEADLIKMMENHGIGTDATVAEHIKTVQDREYAGYEHLSIFLARPEFRSKMESDMGDIARGRKQKGQIVSDWMGIMSPVLQTCMDKTQQLVSEMRNFFQPVTSASWQNTVARHFSKCGDCGGSMSLKSKSQASRNGNSYNEQALICQRCDVPYSMPKGDPSAFDHRCPICDFQVILITAETGKQHHICPKCFNHPPNGSVGNASMRCFQCTHSSCRLASSSGTAIRPCFECGQDMVIKRSHDGKTVWLGCQGSPECKATIWLPKGKVSPVTPEQFCSVCESRTPVRIVKFNFKAGTMMAHIPLQLEGCIGGCNREIRSLIEERNKAHLYPRIFFPRGPPRVTIHANGGGGDVDDGDRRHQGRTQVDSHQPGRQALGQISHGSQRVNGRDEDMEDIVVVGSNLNSFLGNRVGGQGTGTGGGSSGGMNGGMRLPVGSGRGQVGGRVGGAVMGGQGGGAQTCFKCGQEGHFASACPNSRVAGGVGGQGGGGQTCFKCGQQGHFANACPNNGAGGMGGGRAGGVGGGRGRVFNGRGRKKK